ncbi:hypothetical protein BC835DRAFT_1306663 [Cytidiella melzeri]|nr:hypothetical protein BC835DRAFT_1306663 [Cytidiella melzeri]
MQHNNLIREHDQRTLPDLEANIADRKQPKIDHNFKPVAISFPYMSLARFDSPLWSSLRASLTRCNVVWLTYLALYSIIGGFRKIFLSGPLLWTDSHSPPTHRSKPLSIVEHVSEDVQLVSLHTQMSIVRQMGNSEFQKLPLHNSGQHRVI